MAVPSKLPPRAWTASAIFTTEARVLAVAVVALAFVFPVNGLGFDLCMLHSATGLPCPGCGLSRGIASIAHGSSAHAFEMNPFAFIAAPLFVGLVVFGVLPARVKASIEAVAARPRAGIIYRGLVYSFAAFGVVRFATYLVMGWRFP